jgi:uncharacterized repeat protein (TIGR02543 family)
MKKKIFAFLLALTILMSLPLTVSATEEFKTTDTLPLTASVSSEVFTTADALTVLKAAAGFSSLTAEQAARFGINGTPTTADALYILKVASGIISTKDVARNNDDEPQESSDFDHMRDEFEDSINITINGNSTDTVSQPSIPSSQEAEITPPSVLTPQGVAIIPQEEDVFVSDFFDFDSFICDLDEDYDAFINDLFIYNSDSFYLMSAEENIEMELASIINWSWPVESRFTTITSSFGMRNGRMHNGIDIGATPGVMRGTSVRATRAGTVIWSRNSGGNTGNIIVIDHGGGFTSWYLHLQNRNVSVGARVSQNQQIGTVGNTGAESTSSGHLHFEIRQGDKPQNPLNYVVPGRIVNPIPLPTAPHLDPVPSGIINDPTQNYTFTGIFNPGKYNLTVSIHCDTCGRSLTLNERVNTAHISSFHLMNHQTHQLAVRFSHGNAAGITQGNRINFTVGNANPIVNRTVTFNPQGGSVSPATRTIPNNTVIGTLPTPTRTGHIFEGWFTAVTGGTRVTTATIVTSCVTFHARWSANTTPSLPVGTAAIGKNNSFMHTFPTHKVVEQFIHGDRVTWDAPNATGFNVTIIRLSGEPLFTFNSENRAEVILEIHNSSERSFTLPNHLAEGNYKVFVRGVNGNQVGDATIAYIRIQN